MVEDVQLISSDTQITPDHTFQLTEIIRLGLMEIQSIQGITHVEPTYSPDNRAPRHVLQKSHDIQLRLEHLLYVNDLPYAPIVSVPVVDATSFSVHQELIKICNDVKSLRRTYKLKPKAAHEPDILPGKTPDMVFANLRSIGKIVISLGSPAITPSDVFRFALAIRADLNFVMIARMQLFAETDAVDVAEMKPPEVYAFARSVCAKVHAFIRKMCGADTPDDLLLPASMVPPIEPEDVMEFLMQMLADIGAMKHVLNIKSRSDISSRTASKMPSDVYGVLLEIDQLMDQALASSDS